MTINEEIRAAASKLRRLTEKTSETPWTTAWNEQQYELRDPSSVYPISEWTYAIATWEPQASEQRAGCDTADADYMAAMHPGVGLALAKWLESWMDVDIREDGPLPEDAQHALDVARVINGGAQ